MERTTNINDAKLILGQNFIGIEELRTISSKLGISCFKHNNPPLPYSIKQLKAYKNDYILILGFPYYVDKTPLTIIKMRKYLGIDPNISEPCFYNQDWYITSKFANTCNIKEGWYFIKKEVHDIYRGYDPKDDSLKSLSLPTALECTYLFFAYFFYNNEVLWQNDYIWCSDFDDNDDQIYVGRYNAENKRSGFEIHRHLKIKKNYSIINNL